MLIDFHGQVAAITGGAGGIGLVCARTFLESGAKVVLLDVNPEALEKAVASLRPYGEVSGAAVNLADVDSIAPAVKQVVDAQGGIDVLVQCAGLMGGKPGLEITLDDWDKVQNVNARGLFFMMQEVVRQSMAARGGAVVNFYLTQPVLSRHINELEKELGGQLFIRNTRKVALTPFGELAAKEVHAALCAYDAAMQNIRRAADSLNGKISVGFLGQAVRPFITQFIQYLGTNSDLRVDYSSLPELDSLIHQVDIDAIDLAFITNIEKDLFRNMETLWIMNDPLYVIVPPGHALARRQSIAVRELSGKPLILFNKVTNPNAAIFHEKLLRRFGVEIRAVRLVNNVESGVFEAVIGKGFFIIPQHLRGMAEGKTVIPFSDEEACVPLYLIWKTDNSKTAVGTFVRHFSSFYREQF